MPNPLIQARVSEPIKEKIEEYAEEHDIKSQSEAMRYLIKEGLEAADSPQPAEQQELMFRRLQVEGYGNELSDQVTQIGLMLIVAGFSGLGFALNLFNAPTIVWQVAFIIGIIGGIAAAVEAVISAYKYYNALKDLDRSAREARRDLRKRIHPMALPDGGGKSDEGGSDE